MNIPTGGPLPGFSPFGGPPVKIFTTQKQHALKLQLLYIVFIGYLSTILAHKSLEFFVLTYENLYLILGGPLGDPVQYVFTAYVTANVKYVSHTYVLTYFACAVTCVVNAYLCKYFKYAKA
jgi:hypothetical protein